MLHLPRWLGGLGMAILIVAVPTSSLTSTSQSPSQPVHYCAAGARDQAAKLLAFHAGPDERIAIAEPVRRLDPIRNPADRSQRFDVLEVTGHIYKGQYRMRFIYAQLPKECVLMGQEILELAAL